MKMVVTSFRKKFYSSKRINSAAFTNAILTQGKQTSKEVKALYDKTHETWANHPFFSTSAVTSIGGGGRTKASMIFGVVLDDENSDLETDRSPYSEPISSGQVWRYLDDGVEQAWFHAQKGFVAKTKPNFIGSSSGVGGMKYRGKLEVESHGLSSKTIEARSWSIEINKEADSLFKASMRKASKEGYNAMRRELSKI